MTHRGTARWSLGLSLLVYNGFAARAARAFRGASINCYAIRHGAASARAHTHAHRLAVVISIIPSVMYMLIEA